MGTNAHGCAGTPESLTLRLDDRRDGGVQVVHTLGRLDGVTAAELQHLLEDQLATVPRAIVLDLSAVSVLEPGAVQALGHVARRAGEADVGLALVTVDGAVIRALVSDADGLFDIYPNVEAAHRAMG